jgi:outer membrane lipoprotein SlyB
MTPMQAPSPFERLFNTNQSLKGNPMKHLLFTTAALAGLFLAGCANTGATYDPIADGAVRAAYADDLESCQKLATMRGYANDDTKTSAVIGAGLGALAGIADDDINDTEGAIAGAVVGAVVGGGAGMLETRGQRRQVVIDCMKGRGHPVVG